MASTSTLTTITRLRKTGVQVNFNDAYTGNGAQKTFAITELGAAILEKLDPRDLFIARRVSREFNSIIRTTLNIQTSMMLTTTPNAAIASSMPGHELCEGVVKTNVLNPFILDLRSGATLGDHNAISLDAGYIDAKGGTFGVQTRGAQDGARPTVQGLLLFYALSASLTGRTVLEGGEAWRKTQLIYPLMPMGVEASIDYPDPSSGVTLGVFMSCTVRACPTTGHIAQSGNAVFAAKPGRGEPGEAMKLPAGEVNEQDGLGIKQVEGEVSHMWVL